MTTTELAIALKKIHKRKFVASELNGYAKQLGRAMILGNNGNYYHLWQDGDIELLKPLIEES